MLRAGTAVGHQIIFFRFFFKAEINSRTYYKTQPCFSIFPKSPEIGHRLSPEIGTRFPEWGAEGDRLKIRLSVSIQEPKHIFLELWPFLG